ncbi:MAG TPA: serine/threonine-protein phosphatase, partial [Flavobacteriales bacterium]|nr:serine/threonine-protein phosphatase [Flavobacteriales bacterium]
ASSFIACSIAFSLSQEIEAIDLVNENSKNLYEIYKETGNIDKALEMYELYIKAKDTLEKQNAIEQAIKLEANRKYEEQKLADSIRHQEEIKREKIIRYGLIAFAVLILVSLVIIFISLKKTKSQKDIIETQHNSLTDSISYAKKIQDALMTSTLYMKEILPESFIFFKPKDVVSGDFYWLYRSPKGDIYFTVADCTGHGVPGAFMSMIGTSLLNENIIENKIEDTAQVLNNMRDQIIKSLKQESISGDSKDGMDMALCKLDPNNRTLEYAGAFNPLIHINRKKITQIKADPQPVALFTGNKTPFTKHEIQLEKGDMIYIFSDGFSDQFGGEKGKKYKSANLKHFLLSIQDKDMETQHTLLSEEFDSWKGTYEQIDDVCVMGVRV